MNKTKNGAATRLALEEFANSSNASKLALSELDENVPGENSGQEASVPAGASKLKEVVSAGAPTLGQRRADALVALAEQSFDGYQIMLHVPAGTSSRSICIDPCGVIPYAAAERICCDASIVPVLEGESGELLDIGRKTRKIPPAIRRALELRDKGTCRFPECTHTRYLHGHHIEHWAYGGATALDNLVLLCSHHHGLVHEGGFGCSAIKRAGIKGVDIVFRRPDGVVLPSAFALTACSGALESNQLAVKASARTAIASDFGTALDVGVVLDALAFRRRKIEPEPTE